MKTIVGALKLMGECVAWKQAPHERLEYVRANLAKDVDAEKFIKIFKLDIKVDYIVEKLTNADIYYIRLPGNKKDELYYFGRDNLLYHGEKIWSKWHSFIPSLNTIKPNVYVENSSYFVGSRDNYTHQMVDFLPNLLLSEEIKGILPSGIKRVFGKENKILRDAISSLGNEGEFKTRGIYLDSLHENEQIQNYSIPEINCTRFRELYLVRHLSIFKAFSMLNKKYSAKEKPEKTLEERISSRSAKVILKREDNRVKNQTDLCKELKTKYSVEESEGLEKLSCEEKREYLSRFGTFIMPPGSENINGLVYGNEKSKFIQMIPRPFNQMLENPFHSYAGIRYNLPFLDRTKFWKAAEYDKNQANSGLWNLDDILPEIICQA